MGDNGRFLKLKKEREGEINYNNFGSKMELINYRRYNDIDIYFEEYDYIVKNREYKEFEKGNVRCPYEPRLLNVGYLGEGEYKANKINGKHSGNYNAWHGMIDRCYNPYHINKYPTYIDVFVCEEWHNFQNFAKWYEENYYEVEGQKMQLDKDILFKGNKIYSPRTCIFVPERINYLFTKSDGVRGDCPIGVSWNEKVGKFYARCNNGNGKLESLGLYNTSIEAFEIYKKYKEKVIKQLADEYKDYIPTELYEAMYKYEVNIND